MLKVIFLLLLSVSNLFLATSYFLHSYARGGITILKSRNIANSRIGNNLPPSNRDNHIHYAYKNDNESQPISDQILNEKDNNDDADSNNSKNPLSNFLNNFSEETRDDIQSTILAFAIAFVVRVFLLEPRYIPSLSMFPTFDIGDQLMVDKVISKVARNGYQRRDVVVFNPSETYKIMTGNEEALIKRIIGIAGDVIEVKNNNVYVNGILQDEPYTNEHPNYDLAPMTVPSGYVLVLGDNRNKSFDSHVWGFLPEKNIIGRAVVKYWPPWRVGFVEGSY